MGWKNVKEHYQIGHMVSVTEEGICIGSAYIHDIIIVGLDGDIKKRYDGAFSSNKDLARYQDEMESDTNTLLKLVKEDDIFSISLPVYTYDGSNIIEKKCEKYEWPNVTHDGELMYENTFSEDKNKVIRWALNCAASGTEWMHKRIIELNQDLDKAKSSLSVFEHDVKVLTQLNVSKGQNNGE